MFKAFEKAKRKIENSCKSLNSCKNKGEKNNLNSDLSVIVLNCMRSLNKRIQSGELEITETDKSK